MFNLSAEGSTGNLKTRNMRHLFSLVIFTALAHSCPAQKFSLKVDSILVIYVPLNFATRMPLEEYEVLTAPQLVRKEVLFKDSFALSDFSYALAYSEKADSHYVADARMVIHLFSDNKKFTTVLNRNFSYSLLDKYYRVNSYMVNWFKRNLADYFPYAMRLQLKNE
jgi:hypothetical protein